jgi:hypothetical protein
MPSAKSLDLHLQQLFDRVRQFHAVMQAAGVPYGIVGGVAAYLHVAEQDPVKARMTPDIDVAIHREHLAATIAAATSAGLVYCHSDGTDALVDAEQPKKRSAVHLVFVNEKVRAEHVEPVPSSPPEVGADGYFLAAVADLVRMKLTSYRLKDKLHIQDLDGVGLITPEIEAELPDVLRQRLAEVRATE